MSEVESAASASNVPLVGNWYNSVFLEHPDGRKEHWVRVNRVSGGYFDTLRIPLGAGRDFNDTDAPGSPRVAIVNDAFVQTILAGEQPLGRIFQWRGSKGQPDGIPVQIVGVAANTKYSSLRESFGPIVYLAERQLAAPGTFAQLLIRGRAPLSSLMPQVSRTVEAVHPAASFHYHDFQEQLHYSLRQDRLLAWLCGFFAFLGAVLSTVGVYGVIAYGVVQRTNEIGIRLTLGARRGTILNLVLREAIGVVAVGLVVGLALALLGSQSARALLYGLPPHDVITMAVAVGLLGAAGVLAALIPARSAARLDPMKALKWE